MGFWSSLGNAIGGVFSAACNTVSNIGGVLSNFATTVAPIILKGLSIVSPIFQVLGGMLGVLKPNESAEELGDRALQAADKDIRPDNFSNFEEYADAIRNFELDPEKSKIWTNDEKELAGIGVISKLIEEKYNLREGSVGQLAALTALNPAYFDAPRLEKWIHSGQDIGKIIDYFDNKLGVSDSFQVEQDLIKVEKQDSDKTEMQIEQEIEQAKTDVYEATKNLEQ